MGRALTGGWDAGDGSEHGAQPLERLRELRGNHPQLVRVAAGEARQHLQVLVGQQTLVGTSVVDRLEDRLDRLRLTLCAQDGRLTGTLGVEDRGLLVALCGEDRRLPLTLRG